MDIRTLQLKKVVDLKEIAKAMGYTELSKYKKDALIDLIVNGNHTTEEEAPSAYFTETVEYLEDDQTTEEDEENEDVLDGEATDSFEKNDDASEVSTKIAGQTKKDRKSVV